MGSEDRDYYLDGESAELALHAGERATDLGTQQGVQGVDRSDGLAWECADLLCGGDVLELLHV